MVFVSAVLVTMYFVMILSSLDLLTILYHNKKRKAMILNVKFGEIKKPGVYN